MRVNLLLGVFLVVLLAGCATARKGQDVQSQELQNRISYLETELQRKSREISTLESELQEQKSQRLSLNKKEDNKAIQLSVRQMQTALKNAGFYRGEIDGKMGVKTKEAISAFQKANGLKVDGIAGKRTLAQLMKYLKK